MKNYFGKLSCLAAMLLFSITAVAQDRLKTRITKKNDKVVAYTVTSEKEFYVGGNKHILHIGNKDFDLYEQNNEEGKGRLTFLIPKEEFAVLKDGVNVYLTYGDITGDGERKLDELCKQNLSPCWSLGKFSKKIAAK